ncbi:MAG: TIGR03792 family protein [Prochlorococcaceae cyanobacterium]
MKALFLAALMLSLLLAPEPAAALGLAQAAAGPAAGGGTVVELLRLGVPAQLRQAWWAAEQSTWGAWLQQQSGFLARQLLWDPARQEGLVLIHWASREQWKAIPQQEVMAVQRRFENAARAAIRAAGESPAQGTLFPLLEEAELQSAPGSDSLAAIEASADGRG